MWVPSPDDPAAGGVFVSYNGSFEPPYGLLAAAAALAAAGPDGVFAALTSSPGPSLHPVCGPPGSAAARLCVAEQRLALD